MVLYNDNCFNVFPKIKDKSINLFLLDLPYGQTACKWDSVIDLDKMWVEIKRMMKPDGIIVFFCTAKFGNTIINSNPKWFKYDLIWKKSRKVGFLSANKMPLRQHENIYVFKDKVGTYNPQKTEGKPYKCKQGKQTDLYGIEEKDQVITKNNGDRHPTSIIEHTVLEYNNPAKSLHRTQKPVELCEWLIKTYTNEGDIVMDFTMGSGTTGIACRNINREFIGVEMDKEIFKIAEERLNTLNVI
tara:strand:+ start:308 stop:1036 length:729 start_codon:yes stop_codon:yes gene_type:complete